MDIQYGRYKLRKDNIPLTPIVSNNITPTYKLSKLLTHETFINFLNNNYTF